MQIGDNRFVVGGTNDQRQARTPMIVDDFEIWYADKDYLDSKVPDCESRSSNERWLISKYIIRTGQNLLQCSTPTIML